MVRRPDPQTESESDPINRDEQLGEAIEAFLALCEAGEAPDPEAFSEGYPDFADDLRAALEGLALVRGLVGDASGPGHRLESGQRIAGYRIVRELGRGGMGTVYEAVHVGLDRPVALKVLGAQAAPDSNGRRRFLNEARTAAGLHHTHIVPVFDVGQVGGLCYYAMQRIEGSGLDRVLRHLRRDRTVAAGSSTGGMPPSTANSGWLARSLKRLSNSGNAQRRDDEEETGTWFGRSGGASSPLAGRDRIDEAPPFDPPRGSAYYRWVAEVGREAAEALAHAHRRGIIHRDVKPSNLLVDARGIVWVADFGLARRLADPGLTHHDSLLGTPRYMSPEQAKTGPIDGRTDVYGLGATLYELLTLRPPFQGRTAAELIDQIGNREPAALRQFDAKIPRDFETIVLKCLAKRPADRYATATDVAEDLERFLNFEPVRARRISAAGRLWRLSRRNPGTSIAAVAASLTILIISIAAYVRVVDERDKAIASKKQTLIAMRTTEEANRKTNTLLRTSYLQSATLARSSNKPERRAEGLKYLMDAAALGPGPALMAKLRDEAAQLLVLRDVQDRPEFATGPTSSIVFGPEGVRLATLSQEGRDLSLWDVAGRKRVEHHRLTYSGFEFGLGPQAGPQGGHRRGPGGIASAGHCLAVVQPDGQGLRLFDATTGTALRNLTMPGRRVVAVFAAPGVDRLVTIEQTFAPPPQRGFLHEARLYDPEQIEKPLATLSSPSNQFPLVAIGPDGKTVATSRNRETAVKLWSAEDGQAVRTIETGAELSALALGPYGLLATAGGGEIRLWEGDSGTPFPGFSPFQSYVRVLRFNPRGTLLAVAGRGSAVEVWDPASHAVVAALATPDRVEDVAFSPDGLSLAAAGGAGVTSVWSVVDPTARAQLSGFDSPPVSLAFRDEDLLAMGTRKGTIRFWHPGHSPSLCPQALATVSGSLTDRTGNEKPISVNFDDKGRLIGVDFDALSTWLNPSTREVLSRVPLPRAFRGPMAAFPVPVTSTQGGRTVFLARGTRLLAWHADDPVRVSPLALPASLEPTGFEFERRRPDPISWRQLTASPAGDRLYVTDHTGTVHALALEGKTASHLDWSLPLDPGCLAISADGALLAVGERHGNSVTLVDTALGRVRNRFATTTGEGESRTQTLAFAPDGRILAAGNQQGYVELWSVNDTTAPLVRLPGHRGPVFTLAYSAKGRYLASGGGDKVVEVWDLERVNIEFNRLGLKW